MKHLSFLFSILLFAAWQKPVDTSWQSKIDPSIVSRLQSENSVEFLVLMKEQADLTGARFLRTKAAKGSLVFNALQQKSKESQKRAMGILDRSGVSFRSYFVVNAIYAKGGSALIDELAQLPEVAQIQPNPWVKLDEPEYRGNHQGNARSLTWGLSKTGADQVWDLGYRGQGVVVAGQDTGTEWEHPSIKDKYRGWDGTAANHNYNWHDAIREINTLHNDDTILASNNPCGLNSIVPCDDHSHGTHITGTMVGDDGQGNQIGLAPESKWIACRNMERGWGSPASYIECFEFFLAPTNLEGNSPDPGRAPHVINNSWGCPPVEGCNEGNFATMETVVNNLKAAGIVVVVSAGNSGNGGCGSVDSPAAIFENSFVVGAVRSNDTIANFSSRGVVTVDGSLRIKPDVSAPGVGVRSAVRGGGYATWNGTSMAGPHVAGLVALMISANPALAGQVETIEQIIEETAEPAYSRHTCGDIPPDQFPNPITGYGQISALAAVQKALTISSNEEPVAGQQLHVFPNPTADKLTFDMDTLQGAVQLQWFNGAGQQLRNENWESTPGSFKTVDISVFAKGIYWYRIAVAGQVFSGKVVKD